MQPAPREMRYDATTMFFHWATAILVATQWLGAQAIDWFPSGPLRVDARSVHITCGALLGVLLLARIAWRLTGGRHLAPADTGLLNLVAKSVQWGLYFLLAAMVIVGGALTWVRGDNIFNLFSIPAWAPGDKALADQVLEIHDTIGWAILAVAGLHASAALIHRYLWKDGVLARMLPPR
jgi:cytochrome b561